MAPSANRPAWQRIYRQTLTLIHKNLLMFYKTPIATVVRALIFPIVFTVIMCELKETGGRAPTGDGGYDYRGGLASSATPILDLDVAIGRAGFSQKLVFIRNGNPEAILDPIINRIVDQPSMKNLNTAISDDPDELFNLCRQTLQGRSECFAAIIFIAINDTNVDYAIAMDDEIVSDWPSGTWREPTLLSARVLPLQWAVDAAVGNLEASAKPSEQAWSGSFLDYRRFQDPVVNEESVEAVLPASAWLAKTGAFIAPVYILILIGAVYHLAIFVATERQTQVSELMQAQLVTNTPRILSTIISFMILYFPGFLISSVLLTQLLFTETSDILFIFLTLLAGTSTIVSTHFLASFFGKAQLAGLYTSTLSFALALISLTILLSPSSPLNQYAGQKLTATGTATQTLALSLIFPPYAWATMIGDTANREYQRRGLVLSEVSALTKGEVAAGFVPQQAMAGYLYLVFYLVQIFVYGVATYGVERLLWGVKRTFDPIDATSDVALRFTKLSKTYHSKPKWYWPFTSRTHKLAVDSLDLEVKKGSVTFLLGPNGCGKSTTLKCAAGMHTMDKGSRLEINEAGVIFGICPQQNVFWGSLTVQENIKIWRSLKTAAFEGIEADDDDVIAECDLLEKSQATASTLSGGQMRKLQLAISFVGGSKVCCIDEASSGLDPLSRRNIWNIIQKGHARRTCLVTTHFLDEADILADHITIMYKGKLVCEGPGTSLKARYGGEYIIRSESAIDGNNMIWQTTNSAEATRKILELEELTDDDTYDVVFPTLEQVFLKVTSDSNAVVHSHGGDGMVGEQEEESDNVLDEKAFALENGTGPVDIDLDVGKSVGTLRQIWTLFGKRYTLLLQKAGWIAYGINLIIPILIAAVLAHYTPKLPTLLTCANSINLVRAQALTDTGKDYPSSYSSHAVFAPLLPRDDYLLSTPYGSAPGAIFAPASEFSGTTQDELYIAYLGTNMIDYSNIDYSSSGSSTPAFVPANETLEYRKLVPTEADVVATITNSTYDPNGGGSFSGLAIYAPTPQDAVLFHDSTTWYVPKFMKAMSLITARIAAAQNSTGPVRQTTTTIRSFRHPESYVSFYSVPIAILIVLGFIAATSIAIIYPVFEKVNRVRALHYCNGVVPFGLWAGYLLFDIQLIIIQSIIVWAVLFTGKLTRLYYEPTYILGVFILFGIASYLGAYVLSLYVKKAAFAVAAGLHIVLFIAYFGAYIGVDSTSSWTKHQTFSIIQYTLGLIAPAANLGRALFVATNVYSILCGKYGDSEEAPMAMARYGSVYLNLCLQIIFLIAFLGIYEYGSADWIRRKIRFRGVPARLHYTVDDGRAPLPVEEQTEKNASATAPAQHEKILEVSNVSKFFGRNFATENISFDVNSNETLALLGGNGAGKTTMINLIRGELTPDFGEISLDGISVLKNPRKTRSHMGVCPQDDAIDNLTVRQTLRFYASVKGLKNIEGNVEKVMTALNINTYEGTMVKALSGGTKRKLSVAIALLGNPRILLLDEPSTGQDAGAKRILWKALQDISANRAILLTTHSMEEAEALATKVAIMGTRMLATGTLSTLQDTYGGLYSVRAVRDKNVQAAEAEIALRSRFENKVSNYEDSHGQISFNLPHDKKALGSILTIMEGLKGEIAEHVHQSTEGSSATPVGQERVLQDYTINGPTLEEVFMNVARESGISGGM